jgi:hypothetical protein
MASNTTVYADEFGDYDDWVELYNRSDDGIDVGGMFLTDDLGNTTRFELPDTTVAPWGFLIIWCDGEPHQGPLHAPFKLSASAGEELGLFDTVAHGIGLIDTTAFGPMQEDWSRARVPDGIGAWIDTGSPSPMTYNVGVGAAPAPRLTFDLGAPAPNPFNPYTRFELALPAAEPVRVAIFDVHGRRVRVLLDGPMPAGRHRLSWDGADSRGRPMPSGVYWIRLVGASGERVARAVLVR